MSLAVVLSLAIGVALGMLGGGGSILTVPLLVYGLGVEQRVAMASSLLVVGATSIVALWRPARAGQVAWRTGLAFAAGGMTGSFFGGRLSATVPKRALFALFLAMMVATAIAMLRRRSEASDAVTPSPLKIVVVGLATGALTGLVGASGGFVIVPALVLVGGLPMRMAVGTSLFVIALQSLTGYLGHAGHVSVDYALVAVVAASASLGALGGGELGTRVPQDKLRRGFGVFILAMASYMGWRELTAPPKDSSSIARPTTATTASVAQVEPRHAAGAP